MDMKYDGVLTISTGLSRMETDWKPKRMMWGELCQQLSSTRYTAETEAEYAAMDKSARGVIKDVGGFVGGELTGGQRKNGSVKSRQLLALDADFGTPDLWGEYQMMFDWACCMHTTHSHTAKAPRYRMFFPLTRSVSAVEYEAIGRRVAQEIGIELFDDTTYQPARLMYWPSTPRDGEFRVWVMDGPWIDPDEILATYKNWRDVSEWPVSRRRTKELHAYAERQQNPLEKKGIVGAFCRTYTVTQAIDQYLPGAYAETDDPKRWTYTGGSTVGGLVIYDDDTFCYSHHDTDPAGGQLCNAFDLVRIHLYGKLGKEQSFEEMKKLCAQDKAVQEMLDEMIHANATKVFSDPEGRDTLVRKDYDYTEQGNAIRMKDTNGDVLRFQTGLGWCAWDGQVWETGAEGRAWYLVMAQADRLGEEAERMLQLAPRGEGREKTPEQKQAEAAFAWAQRCRGYANQRNTLAAASKLMEAGDIDEFDPDPWLLNTPEGVVDLRTGEMREHESKYMCTKITSVAPRMNRPAPKWKEFLHQVTGGDEAFERYLQMVAGMACVGKVYEEGLVISYGPGSNGKSTLFAVWQELLGSYSGTIRNEVLVGNKNGSEVQGAAQLRGMRLVVTSELEEATRMNLSLLKRLTSRDRISARPLYQDPIEFTPTHTLILHTNHLPRLSSCDDGTKRRIAIAPFTMSIPPEKKIADFAEVLVREEGPEILGWMIEGAVAFYKADMKLAKPKVVLDATAEYFAGEDKIGRFIIECCEVAPEARTASSHLYRVYCDWCKAENLYPGGTQPFVRDLKNRGHQLIKTRTCNYILGLKLSDGDGL